MEKLATLHYRGLCRTITKELNEIDRNGRTGNYKKICRRVGYVQCLDVTIANDCIANFTCDLHSGGDKTLELLDQTSLSVKILIDIPDELHAVTNTEIVVFLGHEQHENLGHRRAADF